MCRNCGFLVCGSCSPQRVFVPRINENGRVCNACYNLLTNKIKNINSTNNSINDNNITTTNNTKNIRNNDNNDSNSFTEGKEQKTETKTPDKRLKNNNTSNNVKDSDNISDEILFLMLKEANWKTWFSVFNKYWLRYMYPSEYEKSVKMIKDVNTTGKIKFIDEINKKICVIQTGILWINIIEAIGLPSCDALSPPDCFCRFYVESNDVLFNDDKVYFTKTIHDDWAPKWNESETIIITNSTGNLIIELWDWDALSKNDFLGNIIIPLKDLFIHFEYCNNNKNNINDGDNIIDDWFKFNISPEYLNKIKEHKYKKNYIARLKSKETSYNLLKHSNNKPLYRSARSMPVLNMNEYNNSKICSLHIQIYLKHDRFANFISHFDPILPPKPKRTPFSANLCYKELNVSLSLCWPLIEYLQIFMGILFWQKVALSTFIISLYLYSCYHPWFSIFIYQELLIIYSCHSYIKKTQLNKKKKNIPLPFSPFLTIYIVIQGVIGLIMTGKLKNALNVKVKESNILSDVDEIKKNKIKSSKNKGRKKTDTEPQYDLGWFVNSIGNNIIKVGGLKEQMWWYQDWLVWTNQMILYISDLFNWV